MRQKGNELCKEGYDYTTLQSDMFEMVMLIEGRMCVCVCVCVCVSFSPFQFSGKRHVDENG